MKLLRFAFKNSLEKLAVMPNGFTKTFFKMHKEPINFGLKLLIGGETDFSNRYPREKTSRP
ncbi:protein of unknown function (plasmid) [Cupriavidus taiwanensis]|uniref:Uncharacterized protein n=1 Tax=Cupriavidus taiwanensis TaxID=164546 RepID=A0A375FHP8_9BURK|nr:protein of unknown function [Cupriavidus taiwanensis]SOZ72117.1 protein of unknown function [Cupriavidus taiwanensis]SOZ74411.1 protein of unknown function [Cupriavidus taiwanensis]SPA03317.1 protein of unknown function [Cupriavidus taiwanensis]SPA11291.1 protein of unknown function [Cupriavidus taiwanensis]